MTAASARQTSPAVPTRKGTDTVPDAARADEHGQTDQRAREDRGPEPTEPGVPRDAMLDIEMRHPRGITVRLTRLAFEGNDIAIDAEIINGADDTMTVVKNRYASDRLRLVDDAGGIYNFIDPPQDDVIELAPGETVSGTLASAGRCMADLSSSNS